MSRLNAQPASAQKPSHARQQRGAASLVIVLMLFFVIALVSAYTSRNLIFEQRTSVNQYRSTMAFEAAEAGVEWAVAMLNAGRIGPNCTEAAAGPASTSFRQRHLQIDESTGAISARRVLANNVNGAMAMCVWTGVAWDCDCPENADPTLPAPVGQGLSPAFAVRFPSPPNARPGVVQLRVVACVRMSNDCLFDFSGAPVASEGRAEHSVLVALKSAVTTPPAAALTVFGNAQGAGTAAIENTDANSGGLTIQAAGAVNLARFTLTGVPGSPPALSVVADDTTLVPDGITFAQLMGPPTVALNWDRVFGSVFGLSPATYRDQPAARVLNCPATGCRAALSALVAANPHRVIWIPGDLTLETAGDIGSLPDAANPALAGAATIVVEGRVRFLTPGINIYGVVHARNGNWEGAGTITGAALIEGDLSAAASPTVIYSQPVINASRLSSGSFVPLPGDWRDFR